MKTWRMAKDKCYLCGVKVGGQYPFTLEEKDDKGNPIFREVASSAKLIEVLRRFDKDNEVIFYICTRCELLTVLDPEREFFRFAFPEEELRPFKTLDLIKWANDITAKTQAQDSQITNLTKDIAEICKAKEEAPKEEVPKEEEKKDE